MYGRLVMCCVAALLFMAIELSSVRAARKWLLGILQQVYAT